METSGASAMQEMWVWSLGQEDPLEEEMATHFSILAWEIPMDRGAWWGYRPWGRKVQTRPRNFTTTTMETQMHCRFYLIGFSVP